MFRVPFTSEQFFGVFSAYNEAVWPLQLLWLGAAAILAMLSFKKPARAGLWMSGFLGALWIWSGVAYHLAHFTAVNPAAFAFGALFVLQGILFLWWGLGRRSLSFEPLSPVKSIAAGGVLLYALAVYPLLSLAAGHPYLASPTFGAPCPAVIYTFGVLLLARRVPWWMLGIPLLWAILGSSAVFAFGVYQDVGLPASALVTLAFVLRNPRPVHV